MRHRIGLAAALVATGMTVGLLATAALASDDPTVIRQEAMKSVGDAAKASGQMLKGQAPFDAAVASKAFATMNEVAKVYAGYFPEGSETGNDTEAAPAIWEDRAGFEAKITKFEQDTAAAMAAAPQDLESFKATFGMVAANCKGCHETYKLSKD